MLQFDQMERRSLGRSGIDKEKFEALAVSLTRSPVPMLSTTAGAARRGLFNVNTRPQPTATSSVRPSNVPRCEASTSTWMGRRQTSNCWHRSSTFTGTTRKDWSARGFCDNHQANICEQHSLTTVVNLFGMGTFFMQLLVFMDRYFDTCVLDRATTT